MYIATTDLKEAEFLLQTLRFASITLLSFHRIVRPANRYDPLRTILELEVVCVCWDALDGIDIYIYVIYICYMIYVICYMYMLYVYVIRICYTYIQEKKYTGKETQDRH